MNKYLRKILFGLIVWAVPFFTSFFIWDIEKNSPKIGMQWFSALMAFTWAVGFAIAACLYFSKIDKKHAVKEGWLTGIVWYIELLILDLIVLVGLFKMTMGNFYPMFLTYLNSIAICSAIGYIIKDKK